MKSRLFPFAGMLLATSSFISVSSVYGADASPVVVTATRTALDVDEVLAPVVVITREQIERQQGMDIADLLRFHAGFDIGRNGGPGQATSLFLRGTDSNHVLVMIDGVRINPGTIGGAALHNLQPELIERIEVVKGPRSALYGSDAIGGVINIITRRATQGDEVDISAAGGSFDTTRFTAGARHASDSGMRFGVDVSSYNTDGFAPSTSSDVKRGHDNLGVNAHVGQRFSLFDVELTHFQAQGNTEYLDFFLAPLDQDFLNSVTALRFEATPSANWRTRLKLSQMKDEIDQNQSEDFAHTDRRTIDWQNDVHLGSAQLLTAGLEFSREQTSAASFGTVFDEDRDIRAAYLQDAIEYGAHRAVLATRYTDYDGFGEQLTWGVDYGYWLTEATRFTAAVGTAFRAPDQTDRFGFGGDPNLKPEKARNVELGMLHRFSPAQRVTLQAFQNDLDQLIEFDFSAGGMINIAQARIRGVELSYEYAAGPWYFLTQATMQDPVSRDSGNQLPRRTKRSVTASLDYTLKRWQLGSDMLLAAERRDSDFSDATLPGYGIVNLHAALALGNGWSLRARVENLFDKEYELAAGFRTAERSYLLQLGWRYGADRSAL
ncbi:MAG: TonB-dependent receptor [Chromatiales bacterium]|jgi:vitamin B12 transporter|nr:TonB-dependent receptor [Chromatiales bacterium]